MSEALGSRLDALADKHRATYTRSRSLDGIVLLTLSRDGETVKATGLTTSEAIHHLSQRATVLWGNG